MFEECSIPRPFVPAPGEAREAREPLDHRKLLHPHVRSAGLCRYPLDDGFGPDRLFCAERVVPGSSWCEQHHSICVVPVRGASADSRFFRLFGISKAA
jgi:hypothetical protein